MKKVSAIFSLLFLCGSSISVKAQLSVKKAPVANLANLAAANFINDISFTPDGLSPVLVSTDQASIQKGKQTFSSALIESFSKVQFKYAMLMDVAVESLNNSSLYKFIENWYGTHYRMGGTNKRGIDCSAFSGTLLMAIYSLYAPRTAREQYDASAHISKEKLEEGDLVFFNTKGGVSHVGVYLSNHHFVHSSASQGVIISSLDDSYYAQRFIGGGRLVPA
ncbi:MAG: NlpC/P60 family protein, partial [Ginsengibacter sp.]